MVSILGFQDLDFRMSQVMLTLVLDQIKRIVQRGGGKFADLDISDCTHLITTVGAVRTQKGG